MSENLVDFSSFKARFRSGRVTADPVCAHRRIVLDEIEGTIECEDCKRSLSAFHVLVGFCREWANLSREVRELKHRAAAIRKTVFGWQPRLRALKEFEKHWWRGNMLPCCPHCGRGLMAEDFANGPRRGSIGLDYEMAMRRRDAGQKDGGHT